ncbi:tetratricopeptide repeat protein [uncultured Ferrimonas sp.]|uniref:tetratricopeptide repeat protein n=1 Tax=uncultured Ferrimonas sp. TaxID=432640 RepID=UPI00261B9799|nr:tetratricopeptide repeat protein [uncultured Ferrimonas sp.]
MKLHFIIFCFCTLLLGCSSVTGVAPAPKTLWHDEAFAQTHAVPSAKQVFALSPQMRRTVGKMKDRDHSELAKFLRRDGEISYDSRKTLNAADTFALRSGNCMSLVIMTAALARANNVDYRYQLVQSPPVWDRQGGLYLINGHVNVQLIDGRSRSQIDVATSSTTIDFLPGNQIRGYAVKPLNEQQLLARYYNNLAAEAMVDQQYDYAYQLLKAAHATDPNYQQMWNTLGVLYRRKGLDPQAESIYRFATELPQVSNDALHNLALLLASQDRLQEWQQVHARLELNRIRNPYYYFDMGESAYRRGEFGDAVRYFNKALKLADYRHEFHFGLSRAYFRNGQLRLSERHMQKAEQLAPQDEKQRYQLKLAALRKPS